MTTNTEQWTFTPDDARTPPDGDMATREIDIRRVDGELHLCAIVVHGDTQDEADGRARGVLAGATVERLQEQVSTWRRRASTLPVDLARAVYQCAGDLERQLSVCLPSVSAKACGCDAGAGWLSERCGGPRAASADEIEAAHRRRRR